MKDGDILKILDDPDTNMFGFIKHDDGKIQVNRKSKATGGWAIASDQDLDKAVDQVMKMMPTAAHPHLTGKNARQIEPAIEVKGAESVKERAARSVAKAGPETMDDEPPKKRRRTSDGLF